MAMNIMTPMGLQMHVHQQLLYRHHQMAMQQHYQPDEITNTNSWTSLLSSPRLGPRLTEDIKIELENKKLWHQFHKETTEMIITKSGRRMFPSVQLSVDGLQKRSRYCIFLEFTPASDRRHKYIGGGNENAHQQQNQCQNQSQQQQILNNRLQCNQGPYGSLKNPSRGWTSAGPAEPQPAADRRVYVHPDSPATGAHWMQHPISFSKLKLTNNAVEHHDNVLLTSMHKYIPRIWIVRCEDANNMMDLYNNPSMNFSFKETEFIAVTAYQNENITKLKIDNNPFAKGFRESGQSQCKRKRQRNCQLDDEEEEGNTSSSESELGNRSSSSSFSSESNSEEPVAKRHCDREFEESCTASNASTSSGSRNCSPLPLSSTPAPNRPEGSRPKLHRPWMDENDCRKSAVSPQPQTKTTQPEIPAQQTQQYQNIHINRNPVEEIYQKSTYQEIPDYRNFERTQYQIKLAFELANMRQQYIHMNNYAHAMSHMDYRR